MFVKLSKQNIQLNFAYFYFGNPLSVYSFILLRAIVNGGTYMLYENDCCQKYYEDIAELDLTLITAFGSQILKLFFCKTNA